jgi:hypothetical protein
LEVEGEGNDDVGSGHGAGLGEEVDDGRSGRGVGLGDGDDEDWLEVEGEGNDDVGSGHGAGLGEGVDDGRSGRGAGLGDGDDEDWLEVEEERDDGVGSGHGAGLGEGDDDVGSGRGVVLGERVDDVGSGRGAGLGERIDDGGSGRGAGLGEGGDDVGSGRGAGRGSRGRFAQRERNKQSIISTTFHRLDKFGPVRGTNRYHKHCHDSSKHVWEPGTADMVFCNGNKTETDDIGFFCDHGDINLLGNAYLNVIKEEHSLSMGEGRSIYNGNRIPTPPESSFLSPQERYKATYHFESTTDSSDNLSKANANKKVENSPKINLRAPGDAWVTCIAPVDKDSEHDISDESPDGGVDSSKSSPTDERSPDDEIGSTSQHSDDGPNDERGTSQKYDESDSSTKLPVGKVWEQFAWEYSTKKLPVCKELTELPLNDDDSLPDLEDPPPPPSDDSSDDEGEKVDTNGDNDFESLLKGADMIYDPLRVKGRKQSSEVEFEDKLKKYERMKKEIVNSMLELEDPFPLSDDEGEKMDRNGDSDCESIPGLDDEGYISTDDKKLNDSVKKKSVVFDIKEKEETPLVQLLDDELEIGEEVIDQEHPLGWHIIVFY